MKKIFSVIVLLFVVSAQGFPQIEYGYDRPKSSTDPWKFGINADISLDWINQRNGIEKQIGWKAGISGEKHLVYNLYFRPVLNFVSKGFVYDEELVARNDVNAYLLDLELTIELKFGDERKGRGFLLYFAPFFTYGIGGTSTFTNQNPINPDGSKNPPANYMQPYEYGTFDDYQLKKEDVGFILGAGYDINHHIEINVNYLMGFLFTGTYNNFRWRGIRTGLTYFF